MKRMSALGAGQCRRLRSDSSLGFSSFQMLTELCPEAFKFTGVQEMGKGHCQQGQCPVKVWHHY